MRKQNVNKTGVSWWYWNMIYWDQFSKVQVVSLWIITHPSQSDQYFFDNLEKALDVCSVCSSYEKVLITGDINAQEREKCRNTFLYQHELKSFNKEATCYRNPNKPRCIDLMLTGSRRSFFSTKTYFNRTYRNDVLGFQKFWTRNLLPRT